jgi:hypothetical protein
MKKLFVLVGVLALLATPAFADEPINGSITVDEITLYAGNPAPPCDLMLTLTTCTGQGPYTLPAIADGDLINEALLEAHLGAIPVDVGLLLLIDVGPPITFDLTVDAVQFGPGDFCSP